MSSLVIGAASFVVSVSLWLFFAVVSVQGITLVLEGIEHRRLPRRFAFSGFYQNIGLLVVLFGLLTQARDITIVGILCMALGLVLTHPSRRPNPIVETVVVIAGGCSVGAIALVHALA